MRRMKNRNLYKIALTGGQYIEFAVSELDQNIELFQAAYKLFRPSSEINVSKSDFDNFFYFQKQLLLNWNKKKPIPKKKEYLLFEKVLNVLFDKACWEDDNFQDPLDLRNKIVMFFVIVLPKDILSKLHLKPEILEMININISRDWIVDEVFKTQHNLKSMLNKKTIKKLDSLFNSVFYNSFECVDCSKVKAFTQIHKRLVFDEDLTKIFSNEILFWDILTIRGNYNISPNKKYTVKMFDITTDYIQKGYKEYVAFSETLTLFGFDPLKDDSYRKAYKTYLKNK